VTLGPAVQLLRRVRLKPLTCHQGSRHEEGTEPARVSFAGVTTKIVRMLKQLTIPGIGNLTLRVALFDVRDVDAPGWPAQGHGPTVHLGVAPRGLGAVGDLSPG
jgi:hypothetical protein